MISTYKEYLQSPKSLTVEEMEDIHRMMTEAIGQDEDALELYGELMEKATDYAAFRARWLLLERSEKMEQDPARTSCHDSVIIKFNMLARYLNMQNRNTAWREILGEEKDDPMNRKRIGDMACYLVFLNSLSAR